MQNEAELDVGLLLLIGTSAATLVVFLAPVCVSVAAMQKWFNIWRDCYNSYSFPWLQKSFKHRGF